MNAMTQAAALASTSISTTAFVSDDELIRICAGHQRLASLVNTDPTPEHIHDAYRVSCDAIHVAKPASLLAIIAKAHAALAEACVMGKGEIPDEGWAPDWAWHVVKDLLRLTDSNPDAELIAVCAEFDVLDRLVDTIHGPGPDCIVDDAEANVASAPLFTRMHVLLDRMDELRATTPAGIQARAYSLAQHGGHGEYTFDCPTTIVGRLLAYLLRDSAALGGLPASTVKLAVSPDADLLEACAEFDMWQRRYLATDFEVAGDDTPEGQAEAAKQREFLDASDPALDRICEMRAVTREGQAARARSLALWDQELMKPDKDYTGDRLTQAIVRDLLAGSAGA